VTVAWLDLEGVRGSLLHRIHANRVVWRSNGREAALEDATLAWSLLWLLLATLSFHYVHVGNATVTVAKTPTKAMPGVDVQSSPVPNKRSPLLAGPTYQPSLASA